MDISTDSACRYRSILFCQLFERECKEAVAFLHQRYDAIGKRDLRRRVHQAMLRFFLPGISKSISEIEYSAVTYSPSGRIMSESTCIGIQYPSILV